MPFVFLYIGTNKRELQIRAGTMEGQARLC
jgi:hypothetical protein